MSNIRIRIKQKSPAEIGWGERFAGMQWFWLVATRTPYQQYACGFARTEERARQRAERSAQSVRDGQKVYDYDPDPDA